MEIIERTAADIKNLKIQGATNIAIKALTAITDQVKALNPKTVHEALALLNKMKVILFQSRPTEPTMRNGVKYILYNFQRSLPESVNISDEISSLASQYINMLKEAKTKIQVIGANRIVDGMTVMTHCHSSIVNGILVKAFQEGKKFDVICTETRPLYQGHITARELCEKGVKTTLIVDSAMRWAIQQKEVDLIIVGADAITSEGVVLNKIGTRLLALAAEEYNVPFYVATPSFKFSPETVIGNLEKIELRDPSEVWENPPANLIIENPAFETVARKYIHGIITELGILPPAYLYGAVVEKYPFIFSD
ncbi:MAG: S-methyl-5-thioribose-1-phosphate isomerase [Candidatus Odinarchaeum yellowstonii]|uniref:S-methyl-5-thioribose-1-phosphate isomerase n=1 Tax=Odinarchaeota yellowstonii (strain LCB_4) TaxID=1841599 RepID=A0AAF0D1S4_ODILC|nr:MAG: S-methyl-5-thioribose-1-phosphate isomerase [Candidatus Odinarchaeum yellowstonii]